MADLDQPLLFQDPEVRPAAQNAFATVGAQELHEEEPLMGSRHYGDERRPKSGGFLRMFGGRPRPEAPRTLPARSSGGALPVEALEEGEVENTAELEIPSFLRRLAN